MTRFPPPPPSDLKTPSARMAFFLIKIFCEVLMPYILSPMIGLDSPGMWFEGPAYEKRSIFSIDTGKMPLVKI